MTQSSTGGYYDKKFQICHQESFLKFLEFMEKCLIYKNENFNNMEKRPKSMKKMPRNMPKCVV